MSKIIPFQQIIFKLMDFMFLFFVCLFLVFEVFCMKSSKPSMCLSSLQRTSVHTSASQFPLQVHSD